MSKTNNEEVEMEGGGRSGTTSELQRDPHGGASEKEARDGTDGVDDYSRVSGMEIHGRAQGIVDHSRSLELET